ncbi:MAG: hypothetical protein RMN52_06785 [Anaerolineae bacterium]|nr:hypothetical protein [Candidatus Roseilinea sp.]MDW8449692.1 hypothetical protein [Anaerolineae bacterium]
MANDYALPRALYDQAQQLNGSMLILAISYANVLFGAGRTKEADESFKTALLGADTPIDKAMIWLNLAFISRGSEKEQLLINEFRKSKAALSEDERWELAKRFRVDLCDDRDCSKAGKNYADRAKYAKDKCGSKPAENYEEHKKREINLCQSEAANFIQEQQYDAAIAKALKGIETDPDATGLWKVLAKAHLCQATRTDDKEKRKQIRQTLVSWMNVLSEHPPSNNDDLGWMHYELGNAYFLLNEYDKASKHLILAESKYRGAESSDGDTKGEWLETKVKQLEVYWHTGACDEIERTFRDVERTFPNIKGALEGESRIIAQLSFSRAQLIYAFALATRAYLSHSKQMFEDARNVVEKLSSSVRGHDELEALTEICKGQIELGRYHLKSDSDDSGDKPLDHLKNAANSFRASLQHQMHPLAFLYLAQTHKAWAEHYQTNNVKKSKHISRAKEAIRKANQVDLDDRYKNQIADLEAELKALEEDSSQNRSQPSTDKTPSGATRTTTANRPDESTRKPSEDTGNAGSKGEIT